MVDSEKCLLIEKELFSLAFYFNETRFTKQHFEMYAKDLIDKDLDQIKKGCEFYRKDPKNSFFPVPPTKILTYFQEDDNEDAYEIIEDIIECVSDYGWNNSKDAKDYLDSVSGDIGWNVVKVFGGWNYLCQNLGKEITLTMFNSQAREFIKGSLSRNRKKIILNENIEENKSIENNYDKELNKNDDIKIEVIENKQTPEESRKKFEEMWIKINTENDKIKEKEKQLEKEKRKKEELFVKTKQRSVDYLSRRINEKS